MKTKISFFTVFVLSVFFSVIYFGCSGPSEILKAPELYRSPALDFTKVSKVAIMPINNYGNKLIGVANSFADGYYSNLKQSQNAWTVLHPQELLQKINQEGLGRGYQNYIADLNTFVSIGGATPLFTKETQNFFNTIMKDFDIQALLFSSYSYKERIVEKSLLGVILKKTYLELTVYTALYNIPSKRVWWVARIKVSQDASDPINELVDKATRSFSENFGKGRLRQL